MENLHKKPSKGILKSSSSFEQQSEYTPPLKQEQSIDKDIKWDEMNILQTLHPVDKDYGHMKIDEPKTPYSYDTTDGEQLSDHETETLDANTLAAKIAMKAMECPKILKSSSEDDEESDDENLTEEEKKKKREFEVKRKMHYNEFQAVKLARKLLEEEGEDEEETEQTAEQINSRDNEDSHQNGANQEVFEGTANERIDFEDIDSTENR